MVLTRPRPLPSIKDTMKGKDDDDGNLDMLNENEQIRNDELCVETASTDSVGLAIDETLTQVTLNCIIAISMEPSPSLSP